MDVFADRQFSGVERSERIGRQPHAEVMCGFFVAAVAAALLRAAGHQRVVDVLDDQARFRYGSR